MGLSDSERITMIRSAVLIQYTRVTDGQTDRRTDGIGVAYTRYSIYAVARKNCGTGGRLNRKSTSTSRRKRMRVAVVGAGVSGLPAIKCCRDEGLDVVCFEKRDDIGGLWNYTETVDPERAYVAR